MLLTLDDAVAIGDGQDVTVTYAATSGNHTDADNSSDSRVELADFVAAVTNGSTLDITAPTLSSSTLSTNGKVITLTFDEALASQSSPADILAGFTVTAGDTTIASSNITASQATSDTQVLLTLDDAVAIGDGQDVTVTYAATSGNHTDADNSSDSRVELADFVAAVTNSSTLDITAPTLSSSTLSTNGKVITLTFDEALASQSSPADILAGFTVKAGDTTIASSNITASQATSDTQVLLTLDDAVAIGDGQDVTVTYAATSGNHTDADNSSDSRVELADFVAAVTNGSTLDITAPTLSSSTLSTNGKVITLTFDEALASQSSPADILAGFTVKAGDTTIASSNITASQATSDTQVLLTLDDAVAIGDGQDVTVTYAATSGNHTDADNSSDSRVELADFVAAVTNNSTRDIVAPNVLFSDSATEVAANGTDITLKFSEGLAGITDDVSGNVRGQFTVLVNGASNPLNSISRSSADVITLVVANKISSSDLVSISYSQSSGNEVVDDQSSPDARNYLADFAGISQ